MIDQREIRLRDGADANGLSHGRGNGSNRPRQVVGRGQAVPDKQDIQTGRSWAGRACAAANPGERAYNEQMSFHSCLRQMHVAYLRLQRRALVLFPSWRATLHHLSPDHRGAMLRRNLVMLIGFMVAPGISAQAQSVQYRSSAGVAYQAQA